MASRLSSTLIKRGMGIARVSYHYLCFQWHVKHAASHVSVTTCGSHAACTATYQLYRVQIGPRPSPDQISSTKSLSATSKKFILLGVPRTVTRWSLNQSFTPNRSG
jgi:hypothetical protein